MTNSDECAQPERPTFQERVHAFVQDHKKEVVLVTSLLMIGAGVYFSWKQDKIMRQILTKVSQ